MPKPYLKADLRRYSTYLGNLFQSGKPSAAVPDLDKLIKMCDVFGVTLDELVGRTLQENENSKREASVEKMSPLSPKYIVGYILLATTLISSILTFALSEIYDSLYILFPILLSAFVCSIVCLCVKNNVGYWCAWAALSPVCVFSFYTVGLSFMGLIGGTQTIAFIIMTFVAYKKFKYDTVQTSKSRTIFIILGYAALLSIYTVPGIFGSYNFSSIYVLNYITYTAFSLLLTYTVCYIKSLKGRQ